jgi:hypothetical protein
MPTWGRLAGTLIVWAMVPACLSLIRTTEGAAQVIIVLILALAATGTSGFIWLGQAGEQHEAHRAAREAEKAKRGASPRVDSLINALDDDDLAELRARLLASDGEAPVPLDSLLEGRERSRRG